jgi:hypothetical protein
MLGIVKVGVGRVGGRREEAVREGGEIEKIGILVVKEGENGGGRVKAQRRGRRRNQGKQDDDEGRGRSSPKSVRRNNNPALANSWKSSEEVRKFFELAAQKLFVDKQEDWYRIGFDQITTFGGFVTFFHELLHPLLPWPLSERGEGEGRRRGR